MQTTLKLRQTSFADARTYIAAAIFIAGNILLPRLCHQFHAGGPTWLPIYFFTLVGTCAYGWRVGLLTALASPLVSSALFAMPAPLLLPSILLKSLLLTATAGIAAARLKRLTLPLLAAIVIAAHLLAALGQWTLTGDLPAAFGALRVGLPGIIVQILGGYPLIKLILKN